MPFYTGGLGSLHDQLPCTVDPEASVLDQRTADALAALITVVIEHTEALALRLERMNTGN